MTFKFTAEQEDLITELVKKCGSEKSDSLRYQPNMWKYWLQYKIAALVDIYGGHHPDIMERDEKLTLDLSGDKVKRGIFTLGCGLRRGKMPRYLTLRLANSNLDDNDVQMLTNAFMVGNAPLNMTLLLGNNNITDIGAMHFARAIESGKFPRDFSLGLMNNNIGRNGGMALLNAIHSEKHPQNLRLHVTGNKMGMDLEQQLCVTHNKQPLIKAAVKGGCQGPKNQT